MKKWLVRVGLLFCCVFVALLVVFWFVQRRSNARFQAVALHLASHERELSDAVLAALQSQQVRGAVEVSELPEALRAPNIKAAYCGSQHINLVVYSNPDTIRGFRVWVDTQDGEHADTPTSITGVYRFSYCDDYPESPTNRLD